jgi:hypothetical protein
MTQAPPVRKSDPRMLDEEVSLQHQRRRARRWDVKSTLGTVLCSLALVYLVAVALVGLLAG